MMQFVACVHGMLPRRWALLLDFLHDPSRVSDPRLRALIYNAATTRAQFYFDGNKRTARLIVVGELMSHGFDAVHVPFSRRLEFNVALDRLFSTDDATALMSFTASCAGVRCTPRSNQSRATWFVAPREPRSSASSILRRSPRRVAAIRTNQRNGRFTPGRAFRHAWPENSTYDSDTESVYVTPAAGG